MFVLSLSLVSLLFFALVIEGFPLRAFPAAPFLSGWRQRVIDAFTITNDDTSHSGGVLDSCTKEGGRRNKSQIQGEGLQHVEVFAATASPLQIGRGKEKYISRLWTFSFWVAECFPLPWISRTACFHYSWPSWFAGAHIYTYIAEPASGFPFLILWVLKDQPELLWGRKCAVMCGSLVNS